MATVLKSDAECGVINPKNSSMNKSKKTGKRLSLKFMLRSTPNNK